MTTEACPYGFPNPEARLVPQQRLKHTGAIELHENPAASGAIVQEYRPLFENIFGVAKRIPGSEQEAYAKESVETALRGMVIRMYGYRSIPYFYDNIQNAFEDTDKGVSSNLGIWSPVEAYTSRSADLNEHIQKSPPTDGLIHVLKMTQATFSPDERNSLATTFEELSLSSKETSGKVLDFKYPGWRELDAEILEKPDESELPEDKMKLLFRRIYDPDINVALKHAVLSAVPGTIATLSELHTALADFGYSEDQRWRISYAQLRKLGILAHVSMTEAGRILGDFHEPDHVNMFSVVQENNGEWEVDFTDPYLKRVYKNYNVANCQGATEIYPLDRSAEVTMQHVQRKIEQRAGDNPLDIKFDGAISAAEMGTLLVVSYAERDKINLVRE